MITWMFKNFPESEQKVHFYASFSVCAWTLVVWKGSKIYFSFAVLGVADFDCDWETPKKEYSTLVWKPETI